MQQIALKVNTVYYSSISGGQHSFTEYLSDKQWQIRQRHLSDLSDKQWQVLSVRLAMTSSVNSATNLN